MDINTLTVLPTTQDTFKCFKEVSRWPMTRGDYNRYRGWDIPADENPNDEGYLVEYHQGQETNDARHTGYISWSPKAIFDQGYALMGAPASTGKTLGNTSVNHASKNVPDIVVFGPGDTFKLICKASSENEGWMKSTKAMEIPGEGCLVQVTTQQRNIDLTYSVAEALTWVPGVMIEVIDGDKANGRRLVAIPLTVIDPDVKI